MIDNNASLYKSCAVEATSTVEYWARKLNDIKFLNEHSVSSSSNSMCASNNAKVVIMPIDTVFLKLLKCECIY